MLLKFPLFFFLSGNFFIHLLFSNLFQKFVLNTSILVTVYKSDCYNRIMGSKLTALLE